jgi:hypothetical protein
MPRTQALQERRRRARLADRALELAAAECEAKRVRQPRQLRFNFKRIRTVQRFGTGYVINVQVGAGGDEFYRRRKRRRLINEALKRARIQVVAPVVTPEWIAEDRRDEFDSLSWAAVMRRAL